MEFAFAGVALGVGLVVGWVAARRHPFPALPTPSDASDASAALESTAPSVHRHDETFAQPPDDTPGLPEGVSLARLPDEPPRTRYRIVPAPTSLRTLLEPMVARGVVSGVSGATLAGGVYQLIFSPQVAGGLGAGSLSLMKAAGGVRAIAVDGAGRIAGQGVLRSASGLAVAHGALIAWQVAAFVTAQRFLVDINKRLGSIEKGVQRLQDWHETDRAGRLDAAWRYAKETAAYLASGAYDEKEVDLRVHRLEELEGDCHGVMRAALRDLEQLKEEAMWHVDEEMVPSGLDDGAAFVEGLCQRWTSQAQVFFFAAQMRAVAAQLRCALPASREASARRLTSLKEELEEGTATIDAVRGGLTDLVSHMKGGWFTSEDDEKAARKELRAEIRKLEKAKAELGDGLREGITEAVRVAHELEAGAADGLELLVEVDGHDVRLWQDRSLAPAKQPKRNRSGKVAQA